MDALFGEGPVEILCIGVDGYKVHTFDLAGYHVADSIAAGTTDTKDLDACESFDIGSDVGHGKGIMDGLCGYLIT